MSHFDPCYVDASVPFSILLTCWEREDHLALLCVVFFCIVDTFHYGVQDQV